MAYEFRLFLLAVFMLLTKIEMSSLFSCIILRIKVFGIEFVALLMIFKPTYVSRSSLRHIPILWMKSFFDSAL